MSMLDGKDLQAALAPEQKICSDPNKTREEYIAEVAKEGYIATYPGPAELFIDIDNDQHYEIFKRSFEILSRNMSENLNWPWDFKIRETPSRSGLPGRHVRLTMPWDLSYEERIAWQAALGSDPVRELLSCLRNRFGDEHPTMLVEKEGFNEPL